jgi:hypothetical protein
VAKQPRECTLSHLFSMGINDNVLLRNPQHNIQANEIVVIARICASNPNFGLAFEALLYAGVVAEDRAFYLLENSASAAHILPTPIKQFWSIMFLCTSVLLAIPP